MHDHSTYSRSTLQTIEKPTVIFDRMCYHKIMHWVDKCDVEISGMGKVIREKDGTFIIKDAMLLPQKNTSASTDIEAKDLCKAMYELRNTPGSLNFWWHSHVNMAAFWSGTDKDTIFQLGQGGWMIATVFNKKAESKTAFFMRAKFGDNEADSINFFLDDIPHRIVTYLDTEMLKVWDAEYDKNVTEHRWKPSQSYLADYSTDSHFDRMELYQRDRKPTDFEIERGWRFFRENKEWWRQVLSNKGAVLTEYLQDPDWYTKPDPPALPPAKSEDEEESRLLEYYNRQYGDNLMRDM